MCQDHGYRYSDTLVDIEQIIEEHMNIERDASERQMSSHDLIEKLMIL